MNIGLTNLFKAAKACLLRLIKVIIFIFRVKAASHINVILTNFTNVLFVKWPSRGPVGLRWKRYRQNVLNVQEDNRFWCCTVLICIVQVLYSAEFFRNSFSQASNTKNLKANFYVCLKKNSKELTFQYFSKTR